MAIPNSLSVTPVSGYTSPGNSPVTQNSSKIYNTAKSRSRLSISKEADHSAAMKMPPKTSRFFKTLPENKSESSTSTHHYNPYLYLQHRTRVNPPLDFSLLNLRGSVKENYQFSQLEETEVLLAEDENESSEFSAQELPVIFMSENEFKEPLDFIEKVSSLGHKYGAIKVVPPSTWATTFSLNTELFWFRSRRQLLNNFSSEMESRLEFFQKLFHFHTNINKKKNAALILNKLPSIDKRTLDLYRLRKYVHLRGGFHAVCKKKLWAQIGRELGYSGRIMTSLSSSLKSAYQRVILDYDMYEAEGPPKKMQKLEKAPKQEPLEPMKHNASQIPKILGSATEYLRPRDILRSKGFHTYFDNLTEPKRSITSKDVYTLESYDFYDWFNQALYSVTDAASFDSKLAPLYNLKQFFEKNLKFEQQILNEYGAQLGIDLDSLAASNSSTISVPMSQLDPSMELPVMGKKQEKKPKLTNISTAKLSPETIEEMFWKVVFDRESSVEIETGTAISSTVHESAFPTVSGLRLRNLHQVSDPWNLNNVPLSEFSVLRFLDDDDHSTITRPSLDVAMLFGTSCWHSEDHFLGKMTYHHVGAPKVWYVVPPQYADQLDQEIINAANNDALWAQSANVDENLGAEFLDRYSNSFSVQEYMLCSKENKVGVLKDNKRKSHLESEVFSRFFKRNDDGSILLNQNFLFPPSYLLKKGIPVYKTIQHPGQYIIKFSRAYSAQVSLGFNVCEDVSFATPKWFQHALEAEKWLCKQNIAPEIAPNMLLLKIAQSRGKSNHAVRQRIRPYFKEFYGKELESRAKVGMLMPKLVPEKLSETDLDYKDMLSDDNLETCYPSKIVLETGKTRFQISLKGFCDKILNERDFLKSVDKKEFTVKYQVYYTDKELHRVNQMLFANSNDSFEWEKRFSEFMKLNPKPKLNALRDFVSEYEPLDENLPQFQKLKHMLQEASKWTKNAQIILRKTESQNAKVPLSLEFVTGVVDQIPNLQFDTAEIPRLSKLVDEINAYETKVAEFLETYRDNLDEFQTLIQEGEKFCIALNSVNMLRKIVQKTEWKQQSMLLVSMERTAESLEEVMDLFETGQKLGHKSEQNLVQSLEKMYNEGMELDKKISAIVNLETVHTNELREILDKEENKGVPLLKSTKKLVDNVFETQDNMIKSLHKTYAQMDKCEEYIEKVRRIRFAETAPSSSDLEFLKEFSLLFDGTDNDLRPKYSDALEILDTARKLDIVTPHLDKLMQHVTRTKQWVVECENVVFQNQSRKLLKEYLRTSNISNKCIFGYIGLDASKKGDNEFLSIQSSSDQPVSSLEELEIALHHCTCRKSHDQTKTVTCKYCGEWYHERCIKRNYYYFDLFENGNTYTEFKCPVCRSSSKPSARKMFKPKYKHVLDLYFAGAELLVVPDEYASLTEFVKTVVNFTNELVDVLKIKVDFETKNDLDSTNYVIKETDVGKLKFYYRKLEACSVDVEFESYQIKKKIEELENESTEQSTPKVDDKKNIMSFGKESRLLN